MGRKSSRELVGDIAEALKGEPQSIREISDAVDADRQSVTKYLEELEDAGIVEEERSGRSRKFYVSEYEDSEAYFGLPITSNQREKFRVLFDTIYRKYRERFGKTPSKLMCQKIAVDVIKDLDLQLPFGRYRYGSITAMNYTPGRTFENAGPVGFGPEFEDRVAEKVEEWGELGFQEAREKQYREEDMELYQMKEDIMKDLVTDIDNSSEFKKKLNRFLYSTPPLEEETEEALIDFTAVAPDLVNDVTGRSMVTEAFKEFWDLIAFYCMEEDMVEFYDEETVESRTGPAREEKKDEVEQAVSKMIDLHEDIRDYEVDQEFKELQGSASEISEEERERREEELEDMDSSDVAREFDLES